MIEEKGIEEFLKYLGLSGSEDILLKSISPKVNENFDEFMENFYSRLDEFGIINKYFDNPESIAQLKIKQKAHLNELISGNYDEKFLRSRKKIGKIHNQKKIPPDIYLGAYTQFFNFITKILFKQDYDNKMTLQKNLGSIFKIFMLDMTIIIDSYGESFSKSLSEQNKVLEDLYEEKANFFKIVVHDLRNPLNILFNYVKLIEGIIQKNDLMDEKTELKFSRINDAIAKLVKMSTDIFLIADLDEVNIAGHQDKIDPVPILNNALEEFKEMAERKNLSFKVDINSNVTDIYFDSSALKDTFHNVLSNAIKFSHDGGKVEIALITINGAVCLKVKDYGVGIYPKEIEDLFNPKIKKSSKPTAGEIGSGFGIYIMHKVVYAHGGRITVEADKGAGFSITILFLKALK